MVEFFRSRQNDDRRRRVLADDGTSPAASSLKAGASARNSTKRYAPEALRDHAPRLIDFIPLKPLKLCALFVLGLALLAGIEAIYATRVLDLGELRLPAFDLAAEGSLNNWYTSLTLDLACVMALVVYSVRRHRLDDYHGRYRIWLWAAACWLWLSIDEAASLHESFQTALGELAKQPARETELAWLGIYALVIGAIAMRLVFEMRPCRMAIATLLASGATLTVAAVAHMGWLPAQAAEYQLLIEEGCEMGGGLLLVFSMTLYARYVVLDAQGVVPAKAQKEAATGGRRSLWGNKAKVDPAHPTVKPSSKRSDLDAVPAKVAADSDEEDEDEEEEEQADGAQDLHKLSKADRKALRRQQERQRKSRLG